MTRRIIVAITGASGAILGVRALHMLRALNVETHLILSPAGEETLRAETGQAAKDLAVIAAYTWAFDDISAPVASGSNRMEGMLVAPCSIKTLSAIANSYADNLIVRAADVCLKEGRTVVLGVRETPLHAGHLRLMRLAAEAGAVIFPPVLSMYNKPASLDEMIDDLVGRMILRLGIENEYYRRWQGRANR